MENANILDRGRAGKDFEGPRGMLNSALFGDALLDLKIMGSLDVPIAFSVPPELTLIFISSPGTIHSVVPGKIVRMIPEGIVTSPIILTVPDHVAFAEIVPTASMDEAELVTVTEQSALYPPSSVVAVIVALPEAIPVTSPESERTPIVLVPGPMPSTSPDESTVATFVSLLVHERDSHTPFHGVQVIFTCRVPASLK